MRWIGIKALLYSLNVSIHPFCFILFAILISNFFVFLKFMILPQLMTKYWSNITMMKTQHNNRCTTPYWQQWILLDVLHIAKECWLPSITICFIFKTKILYTEKWTQEILSTILWKSKRVGCCKNYFIPLENPANNILKAVLKPIAQGKRKFKKNSAVYRK